MFGLVLTLMFANGLVSVYSVKEIKYIVIQSHHYPPSIHLMLDLTTSTLTLSDRCLPQMATPTCSHVSIDSPVWIEAIPLKDIFAESIAHSFVSGWISRFGVPSTVTTDRGRQFESDLFKQLLQTLGSTRIRTTSYHPMANGMVERFHRQLKAALKSHPNPTRWTNSLPLVLLGIRSSLKADIGCTAAELVYGTTLRLPGSYFNPSFYTTATCINRFCGTTERNYEFPSYNPSPYNISTPYSCEP